MFHCRWSRSISSLCLIVTTLSAPVAIAQSATPAGVAPGTPAVAPPNTLQVPPYPALQFPKQIDLKFVGFPAPSSGPGWWGSLVLGAMLAAISSIATTVIGANKRRDLETALQNSRHAHDISMEQQSKAHQADLKRLEQSFQKEMKHAELQHEQSIHVDSLSRKDQEIATTRMVMRQQTDASDLEIEIAVARMVRE